MGNKIRGLFLRCKIRALVAKYNSGECDYLSLCMKIGKLIDAEIAQGMAKFDMASECSNDPMKGEF